MKVGWVLLLCAIGYANGGRQHVLKETLSLKVDIPTSLDSQPPLESLDSLSATTPTNVECACPVKECIVNACPKVEEKVCLVEKECPDWNCPICQDCPVEHSVPDNLQGVCSNWINLTMGLCASILLLMLVILAILFCPPESAIAEASKKKDVNKDTMAGIDARDRRIAELEKQLSNAPSAGGKTGKDKELAAAKKRIAELESSGTAKDIKIIDLETECKKLKETMAELQHKLSISKTKAAAVRVENQELVESLEDEIEAHVVWRGVTRSSSMKESQAASQKGGVTGAGKEVVAASETDSSPLDLASANLLLAAQLHSLQQEFVSYKETSEKLIADLQAKLTKMADTAATHVAAAAKHEPARDCSHSAAAQRGASRLAKLGLDDTDEVAVLKKQLADLKDKADSLAGHLSHAKMLASRAVHTMVELQAQNVELKGELVLITTEFEAYKARFGATMDDLQARCLKDAEEIAQLKVLVGTLREEIEGLRSKPAVAAVTVTAEGRGGDGKAARDQLTVLVVEFARYKKAAEENLAKSTATVAVRDGQAKKDTTEITALKKQVADLTAQVKSITAEFDVVESEIVATKQQLKGAVEARAQAEGKVGGLDKRIAELEAKAKKDAATVTALQTQGKTDADEIAALKKRISALEGQGKKDTDEIAALKKQLADAQAQGKKDAQTIANLQAQGKKDTDEIAALKKRISDLETRDKKETDEIAALKKQLKDMTDKLTALAKEYAGYKEHMEGQATKNAQTISDLETHDKKDTDEITALKKQLADAIKGRDISMQEKASLMDISMQEKASLMVNYDDLSKELEALRCEHDSLKDAFVTASRSHKDDIEMLSKLDAESREEVAKLTADMAALAKASTETAQKSIADLEAQLSKLQSQVASDASYRDATSKLQARVAELEAQGKKGDDEYAALQKKFNDLTASSAAAKTTADKRIAELEGQGKKDTDEIAALKKRIAELEAQGKKGNDEFMALTKKLSTATAAKAAADTRISDLETRDKKEMDEIAALKRQVADLTDKLMALAKEYAGYKDTTTKTIADLEAKAKKDASAITALQAQGKKDTDEIAALKKELTDAQAQGKKDAQTIANLQAQGKKDTDEIALLKKQLKDMTDKLTALAKEYQTYKAQMEGKVKKDAQTIADLRAQSETLTVSVATSSPEREGLRTQHTFDTDMIATLKKQLAEAASKYAELESTASGKIMQMQKERDQLAMKQAVGDTTARDQLALLAKEYAGYKEASSRSVGALENRAKQDSAKIGTLEGQGTLLMNQLGALVKEYQAYKAQSEKTVGELTNTINSQGQGQGQGQSASRDLRAGTGTGTGSGSVVGDGSSTIAALRAELAEAQTQWVKRDEEYQASLDAVADVRRQYALLDVQRNEMRRMLWTLREVATSGSNAPVGQSRWTEVLGSGANIADALDLQSTFSDTNSMLSSTAEDFNHVSRQPSVSCQSVSQLVGWLVS